MGKKKVTKKEKKFHGSKKLGDTVQQRKHRQRVREVKELHARKKEVAELSARVDEAKERRAEQDEEAHRQASEVKHLEMMDADQFLSGGFLEQLDSDDDNDEQAETLTTGGNDEAAPPESKAAGRVSHREELELLKKTDPEFFEFLQKEDSKLLEFSEDEESDEEEASFTSLSTKALADSANREEQSDGSDSGDIEKVSSRDDRKEISLQQVVQWLSAAREGSLVAATHLTQAFRAACHINDVHDDDDVDGEDTAAAALEDEQAMSSKGKFKRAVSAAASADAGELVGVPGKKKRAAGGSGAAWRAEMGSSAINLAGDYLPAAERRRAGRFVVRRAEVFDAIMVSCFSHARQIFDQLCLEGMSKRKQQKQKWKEQRKRAKKAAQAAASDATSLLTGEQDTANNGHEQDQLPARSKLPGWSVVQPIARSYTLALVHFLRTCVNNEMKLSASAHVELMSPFFVENEGVAKGAMRALLGVWSDPGQSGQAAAAAGADGDDEAQSAAAKRDRQALAAARIRALMALRALSTEMPKPFDELCLKNIYLCFLRNAKFSSPSSASLLQFMENSVVEVLRLSSAQTVYSTAFVYVRQLAVHLRSALVLKTKESRQSVLSWTFLRALRMWARAVGLLADSHQLRPLIFPLVQTSLGLARVADSYRYIPLRLHICRLLAGLARNAGSVFINISGLLMDLLTWPELNKAGERAARGGSPASVPRADLNFSHALRAPKAYLSNVRFQTRVLEQTSEVALFFFSVYSRSIAFPELAVPLLSAIKRGKKAVSEPAHRRILLDLASGIESNVQFIKQRRRNVDFAPTEAKKIERWQVALPSPPLQKQWNQLEQFLKRQQSLLDGHEDEETAGSAERLALTPPEQNTGSAKRKRRAVEEAPASSVHSEAPALKKKKKDKSKKSMKRLAESGDDDAVKELDYGSLFGNK